MLLSKIPKKKLCAPFEEIIKVYLQSNTIKSPTLNPTCWEVHIWWTEHYNLLRNLGIAGCENWPLIQTIFYFETKRLYFISGLSHMKLTMCKRRSSHVRGRYDWLDFVLHLIASKKRRISLIEKWYLFLPSTK